jgi:hypothetical protein
MGVPLPKHSHCSVGWLLAVAASGCSLLAEPPQAHPGRSAGPDGVTDLFWPCRPVLSGELIVNELLIRPGGVDLDGDGQSTGRDEALELRSGYNRTCSPARSGAAGQRCDTGQTRAK